MRLTALFPIVGVIGACAARAPDAQVAMIAPPPSASVSVVPIPASAPTTAVQTTAAQTGCGAQPTYPKPTIEPTCGDVELRDGRKWHDQLTLQLSSGATTRIDCPRMRFLGQDTPICVARNVRGQMRGACCPPGHADPTDPECVAEGSVDEMFRRKKVWEWCSKTAPLPRPCEPCVWVTGAER